MLRFPRPQPDALGPLPLPKGCVLCHDGLVASAFYTVAHRAVTWASALGWCRACGRTWPTTQDRRGT